jgi:hypothetical protein
MFHPVFHLASEIPRKCYYCHIFFCLFGVLFLCICTVFVFYLCPCVVFILGTRTVKSTYLLTYLLTYSMEQSPSWKADWFAASQEIPSVLWNPKVPHHTHKRPPPIPILIQPNPVLTPTSHFVKIHPITILPSTPGSPQRSLSLRFPHQNPVHTSPLPHTCYMPRPSQFSRFYHPHDIG